MPPAPLDIRLFGPLSVSVHGEALPRFRSRSVGWLLALLALRPGRAVERSWLAGTLWPESTEETALRNLRDTLMHLRRALGPEAERLEAPSRDRIAFAAEGIALDVREFDRGIAAGDEPSLLQAVTLYTGPLLEDCLEEWAIRERENRATACLGALERLGELAAERADWSAALELFRRAEQLDPLRDSVQRGLLRSLAAAGDVPEAIHAYREFRLRLHRELNAEPDPETTRLFQQLRDRPRDATGSDSRPGRPAAAPSSPTPAAAIPNALPATAALPHPLTALIGRDEELAAVTELLGTSRLVTVVGGGGLGKTRLAIEVGRRSQPAFPEGVAFLPLAGLTDPHLLPAHVAELLGVDNSTAAAGATAAVAAHLAAAELLLVLDNCEHLVDPAAQLAQALLEQCPRLRILATSRQRLGIVGEVVWRIPSLAAPEEGSPAGASLEQYPAARLLLERLEMVRPGFRAEGPADAAAIAQICRRLDGIPLALELAAARAAHLTVEEIAVRLDDRFRLLTSGSRSVLPRHRTLRTLVDWSYDLLDERQRRLLARLAVFAGGWTLDAAEEICAGWSGLDPEDLLDLLTGLVEQSLVQVDAREGSSRYTWLETLREYALERLRAGGEEAQALRRHRDYFLQFAEARAQRLDAPDQARSLAALQQEYGNLRAALAFSRDDPESPLPGLRLVIALRPYWRHRAQYQEGREHFRSALDRAVPEGDLETERAFATAFYGAAAITLERGDPDEAERLIQQSRVLCERLDNSYGVGRALNILGSIALVRDQPQEARPYYLQALEISRRREDQLEQTVNLGNLGAAALADREYQEAVSYYRQALALAQARGSVIGEGFLSIYLGLAILGTGNLSEAAVLYASTARILLPLGVARYVAEVGELGAGISAALGNFQHSLQLYGAAEALRHEHHFSTRALDPYRKERDLAAAETKQGQEAREQALAEGRAANLSELLRAAER